MVQNVTLYESVVNASKEYLGPAGERFIRRQIDTHLGIEPEKLRSKDLPELVNWVSVTFAMLTKNTEHVENFSQTLHDLTKR